MFQMTELFCIFISTTYVEKHMFPNIHKYKYSDPHKSNCHQNKSTARPQLGVYKHKDVWLPGKVTLLRWLGSCWR